MRRTLAAVAVLVATMATQPPAQAGIGDSGTFRVWIPVSAYPCESGCTAGTGVCGSFRQGLNGPDFDSSCFDQSGAVQGMPACAGGTAYATIAAAPTDPGYNRGAVVAAFTWLGAYAVVSAEFFTGGPGAGRYSGVGAAVVTPHGLAAGALVDACDGFGPGAGATVQFAGVWVGTP